MDAHKEMDGSSDPAVGPGSSAPARNGSVHEFPPRPAARSVAQQKATAEWQLAQWRRWPRGEDWPGILDVFEAAAYLRISPDYVRRALQCGRDGRARLRHQRHGAIYRIRRADLDTFGLVENRGMGAAAGK